VMADGRIVFETAAEQADRVLLGRHMAGHGDTSEQRMKVTAPVHAGI